jgi:hypothetical protein
MLRVNFLMSSGQAYLWSSVFIKELFTYIVIAVAWTGFCLFEISFNIAVLDRQKIMRNHIRIFLGDMSHAPFYAVLSLLHILWHGF